MEYKPGKIAELKVEGMTCTNCALGIKKSLEKEGFALVNADFASNIVSFELTDESRIPLAIKRIEGLGYSVVLPVDDKDARKKAGLSAIELKFWFTAIFTIPLLLAKVVPLPLLHNDYFQLVLTTPVFAVGFWHFGRSAFNSLRSGVTNMDVLIFLGSTSAFVYSLIGTIYRLGHDYMFYETAASIITIILLGNMLEQRAIKKTTSAVCDLLSLQKNIAKRIIKRGLIEHIEEVDSSLINTGDLVLVNTGDKVPIDGEIYWGNGTVDESMITGESLPVAKGKADKVVGGTILLSGTIKVKTTAVGEETVLSQIIELVKTARQDKPKLQNLADRISIIFVPVVVGLSLITIAGWLVLSDLDFRDALLRGIAVLLIACPCALGLATPTAVMVGLGRLAKKGILMKGASTIDKFSAIKSIVFDKTGTLTTGRFTVKAMQAFTLSDSQVWGIIGAMEKHSQHPIAKALVQHSGEIAGPDLAEVFEDKGVGLQATGTDGQVYQLGSYAIASHLTQDHHHNVYLLVNGRLAAWVDIEDEIKPEAVNALQYLKNKGLNTVLLSGDTKKRCTWVAAALGINEVHSEVLPGQKLEIIKILSQKHRVAMVGDGINDAPALSRADVGISMSDATQIAVKSADVIILRGNLELLSMALGISKTTLLTIKENLFWAFFYNVAAIPLAIAGVLTPMIAAVAMVASSLIVVLNSARLKHRRVY
ncbi:MAG TPA: cation-translocating P-type ATPase [Bacteroidales bacterium]|nr:cation-translocating P-type ATPase [Bacteroidales bacterium]